MDAHLHYPLRPDPTAVDHFVLLRNVTWNEFIALADKRGGSLPRMKYLEGILEVMMPSKPHERIKTTIGRMLEFWAHAEGIDLTGLGSYTIKDETGGRAAEADECYVLGDPDKEPPDLAIEVIWTQGGIDKLEVYRALGVGELWLWNDGAIEVHVLKRGRYARRGKSELLPDFDLELVEKLLPDSNQPRALRAFEAALKRRRKH